MSTADLTSDLQRRRSADPLLLKPLAPPRAKPAITRAAAPPKTVQVNPGDDLRAKANSAAPFDTIVVADGTYKNVGQIQLKQGQILRPAHKLGATIEYAVANSANNSVTDNLPSYGIIAADGATVTGFNHRSPVGVIFVPPGTHDFTAKRNRFTFGYSTTTGYYDKVAINASHGSYNLAVWNNTFIDSPTSHRNCLIFDSTGLRWKYNRSHNCQDGGHVDNRNIDLDWSYNYSTEMHRMGCEAQNQSAYKTNQPGDRQQFIGNVVYDGHDSYFDTFGLSIPPTNATNVRIADNYLRHNFRSGANFQRPGDPNYGRAGYGIEADFNPSNGIVENNIVGGNPPWVAGYVSAQPGLPYKNNRYFGAQPAWGVYAGEGGNNGPGSWKDLGGNTYDADFGHMPLPPTLEQVGAGVDGPDNGDGEWDGSGSGGGNGGDTMTVTATRDANDKGKVSVAFSNSDGTVTGAQTIKRYATGDMNKVDKQWDGKTSPFVDTEFTDAQKNSTWEFVYDVAGSKSNKVQIGPSGGGTSAAYDLTITQRIGADGKPSGNPTIATKPVA